MGISAFETAKLQKKLQKKLESGEKAHDELTALHDYNRYAYPVAHYKDEALNTEEKKSVFPSVDAKMPESEKTKSAESVITPEASAYDRYKELLDSKESAQKSVMTKVEDYLESLTDKYDALLSRLGEGNYKDYELYEDIVSDYVGLGKRMAYGAAADAASANSGNVDSLSAANAHRQMLAYKNAGENAAKEAYAQAIQDSVEGLKQSASDIGDIYSLLSLSADRLDSRDLGLLDAYRDYHDSFTQRVKAYADGGYFGDIIELDPDNATNRMDQYMNMLIALYPSYSEEIQNMFHPI